MQPVAIDPQEAPPAARSAQPDATRGTGKDAATEPLTKPGRKQWAPRMWMGMDLFGWLSLLRRNRFAIAPHYIPIALFDTAITVLNTGTRWAQSLIYGWRVRRTPIEKEPLFVVGHWRCGTTLLHELLILDKQHTYPTAWACIVPGHFLVTEVSLPKLLRFLLPSERPMDNMSMRWDGPQEDEFALCNLGVPSPYNRIAFPNHPQGDEYLDLKGLPAKDLARWKRVFVRFIRQLTYRNPKRVVLKSPPHTCRIPVLLELFPNAKFLHIVRDPSVVFPSTMHLWKSLYLTQGLQKPTFEGLEEYVLANFERMHERWEETRGLIPEGNLHCLRYEDLVSDPVGEMQRAYDSLDLGDFETVRAATEAYFEDAKDYKTNRYALTDAEQQTVRERWGPYMEAYGYADRPQKKVSERRGRRFHRPARLEPERSGGSAPSR